MNSYKMIRLKVNLIKYISSIIYLVLTIFLISIFKDNKIQLSINIEYMGIGSMLLLGFLTIIQNEPMLKIDVFQFSNKLITDKQFKINVFFKVTFYLFIFYYGFLNVFSYTNNFFIIFKSFVIMVSFRAIKVMQFNRYDYIILTLVLIANIFNIHLISIWILLSVVYFQKKYILDSTSMYVLSLTLKDIKESFINKNDSNAAEIYYKKESRYFIKRLDFVKNPKTFILLKLNTLILKMLSFIVIIIVVNLILSIIGYTQDIIGTNVIILLCIIRHLITVLNRDDANMYKNKVYSYKICKCIMKYNYFIIYIFSNILFMTSYIFIVNRNLVTFFLVFIFINLFIGYFQSAKYYTIINNKIIRFLFENFLVFLIIIFI